MPLTPTEVDFVESIAQQQIKYETIFSKQAEVLRTNPPELERVAAQLNQSPLVAKRGQRWQPTLDKVDEYLAQCDEICGIVPLNFEELSLTLDLAELLRF
jgi:hypothetical protein